MNRHEKIFDRNIAALQQRNPVLAERMLLMSVPDCFEIVYAKNGLPVPKINNITFHSLYDPVKEGRGFVEAHMTLDSVKADAAVVIFGFGFAYHIQAMLEKGIHALIVEPDREMLRLALEHVELQEIVAAMDIVTDYNQGAVVLPGAIMWHHAPSVKKSKADFEKFKKMISDLSFSGLRTARGLPKSRLKIMVVSPIYGGSLPIAQHCCHALKKLGHEAEVFDASLFDKPFQKVLSLSMDDGNKKVLYDLFLHLISEMIVAECGDKRPDLVLAMAQAPLSIPALVRLRESSITTAFWFVEDYTYMDYWKGYAPCYDFYFTIQEDVFFEELKRLGVKNYFYLPMAADPDMHKPLQLTPREQEEFGSDLSFMGAGYYNRHKMFCGLLDFDFKIWGTQWDIRSPVFKNVQRNGDRLSTEDTVKIFNAAKVNINLHSSPCFEGIHPAGDFVNPRTFEIASCGAFQLVDQRSALGRHFALGDEMISYSDIRELRELAAYYLTHAAERAKIACRARDRVLHEHTYEHRMKDMLLFIKERKPECFYSKAASMLEVGDADSFCAAYPEVRPILEDVAGKGWAADIDHIAASIRSKSGRLEYPEALFLLIKEYQSFFKENLL
ncbi:MAG: glycosyltransferase [Pseudomonadota bacterium]